MKIRSFLNTFNHALQSNRSRRSHRRRSANSFPQTAAQVEAVESRQLLSAVNDLAALSDEFDADTTDDWLRINEFENWNADQLQTYDINQTQPGRMVMAPHSVVWYQDYRGPMAFKQVTGDFVVTTQVHISDRDDLGVADADDIPNEAQFSLGGVMIRTPRSINDPAVDWQPGSMQNDGTNNGENYIFLSLGHGTDGQMTYEVKTTRNSNSQLELTSTSSTVATLQIARIGTSVITLMQEPGQPWVVHRRYHRPDLPATMQVGIVSYTDWGKASDFDEFYHNGHVISAAGPDPSPAEPFNPDLVAGYEYARYFRPQVPAELEGMDLASSGTDQQLLEFLGSHANVPANEIPVVQVETLTGSIAEGQSTTTGFRITRSGSTSADLELDLQVDGTATNGTDYESLPASVTIPAGASSVDVPVTVVDDSLIEGSETIEVSLVDSAMIELANSTASLLLHDNDFALTGPQTVPAGINHFQIDLPAADVDGRSMTYQIAATDNETWLLDQQYDFWLMEQYHENWGGLNERWIRGNGQDYFYLLPDGQLFHWQGSFEHSLLLAELPADVYADPALLIDVTAPLQAEIQGTTLVLNAAESEASIVNLVLTKSNGLLTATETIPVELVAHSNSAPVIDPISDVTADHSTPEIVVPISASDVDGDALTFYAEILGSVFEQLDQQYGFESDGNYFDNWGGQSERWIRATQGDTEWFFLLPDGSLNEWGGSFATSNLIADLSPETYNSPALLTNPTATDASIAIDGTNIVIQPAAGFVGQFSVRVTAADSFVQTFTEFDVVLTNTAPDLQGPDLLQLPAGGTVNASLTATDSNGDALTWSAEVVGTQLDQLRSTLQLQPTNNFYTDWAGRMEKWIQNAQGDWFYLLSDGTFWRWEGSFESSSLLASLDSAVYDDPQLLLTPSVIEVSLTLTDGQLTVTATGDVPDEFDVLISVSDGLTNVTKLIRVQLI